MISPVYASLISVLVECMLYGKSFLSYTPSLKRTHTFKGIYIPLFIGTGFVLRKRRAQHGGRFNIILITVTVLLFLLATLHIAGSMQILFETFIFPTPGQEPATENNAHPINQYRKALDTIAILIGDGLVVSCE